MRTIEHQLLPDVERAYATMKQVVGLQDLRPWTDDGNFYQYIGVTSVGRIPLLSYASAPVDFALESSEAVYLVGCFQGTRKVQTPLGDVHSTPRGGLLLTAPGDCNVSGADSVAVMALQMPDILSTAMAMTARSSKTASHLLFDRFRQPIAVSPSDAVPLLSVLQHINDCYGVDPGLPSRLGLDDVVYRITVSLIAPQICDEDDLDSGRASSRAGRTAFDELIDYIKANLDQPLRLTDLEARSGYSRRALQYAFLSRLGTSPSQWIREQRLLRAMECLTRGAGPVRIKDIALICGYKHKSLFHADFKRRFGITPSEALRRRL
jgi:AraC-like DNA-binding protein